MKVLVLNAGSSSLKYKLLDMAADTALASGLAERIGQDMGRLTHEAGGKTVLDLPLPDHKAALARAAALLTDPKTGVIADPAEVGAVGHRVVHGGERFSAPAVIDEAVLSGIRAAVPLAPLHNPANLQGIETAMAIFPKAPQVAVFDTAFHQTMPKKAFLYALPYELYEKYGVRRYGFHGASHRYIATETARLLGKPLSACDLVTVHLGNGDSVCAIKGGQSVDTSMGMTPLAGTIMGTRSGDIDPEIPYYLERTAGLSSAEIDDILNKKSGLVGICGSSDMRDIHARRQAGDERAELAFEMFALSIRKYIGAYIAVLGRVDAVTFTAGIGEHDPATRELCLKGLAGRGLVLDPERNRAAMGQAMDIGAPESPVRLFAIPTDEEREIARETVAVLSGNHQ